MCGIFGLVDGHASREEFSQTLHGLGQSVSCRGADGARQGLLGPAGLGVRHPRVVQPDGGHPQPATNEDGTVLAVLHGTLYNYPDYSPAVTAGHVGARGGAAELIPHLYEEHGKNFPGAVRGAFAIALWDLQRELLLLTRDHLGEKPLYYHRKGARVVFGSLFSSLRAHAGRAALTPAELREHVDWGFRLSDRAHEHPHRVSPGAIVTFKGADVRERRYWTVPGSDGWASSGDIRDGSLTVAGALDEACNEQLPRGESPWQLLLSGGLDSSLLAAHLVQRSPTSGRAVSVSFEGDSAGQDDRSCAALVARALRLPHREVVLTPAALRRTLVDYVKLIDEPVGDPGAPALAALCEELSGGPRLLFTGAGADEVFGGYPEHHCAAQAGQRRERQQRLLARQSRNGRFRGPSYRHVTNAWHQQLSSAEGSDLNADQEGPHGSVPRPGTYRDRLNDVLAFDLGRRLPNELLLMGNRTTTSFALEPRSPYLHHRLVELAFKNQSFPPATREHPKPLLHELSRSKLPESILKRPKQGFPSPLFGAWFEPVVWPFWNEVKREPPPSFYEVFDRASLEQTTHAALHGDHCARRLIWRLTVLGRWSRATGIRLYPAD